VANMRELKHSISIELDGKKLSGYEQGEQSLTISNALSDIERSFETHFNACFKDVKLKNLRVEWDEEALLLQLSWKSVVLKKQPFKNKGSFLEIMELPVGNWRLIGILVMLRGGRRECCAGYPEGLHACQNTALDGCTAFATTSLNKSSVRLANHPWSRNSFQNSVSFVHHASLHFLLIHR
jgi:hypothetical protein